MATRSPSDALPAGRYFSLAWTIPDRIGGLTGAMLHRSRSFAEHGGVPVDVLTFDNRVDYPEVEQRLRAAGLLLDGMRLINLWEWLRTHPVTASTTPLGDPARAFTPLAPDGAGIVSFRHGGLERHRSRRAADGRTVLQTDYYRADGSLLATDRKDVARRGTLGGRSVVLCDADGSPIRSWSSIRSLYRCWLDRLTAGDEPSYLIADGKPVGNFLHTYRRRDRVTVHVVHGSHLAGSIGPWGRLRPQRAEAIRNAAKYDAIVFLTDRQRRDVRRLLGESGNTCVIPNSRELPPPPVLERPPHAGVVLSTLSGLKRPQHAVRAVALARRLEPAVTLDVYGDGERREALERSASDAIRLHGWQSDARDRLDRASFLLLTSRSEGFGLVLLEAMAAGCIPIAYDIRYGPAEVIEQRRSGFLVTSGNVLGLARAIVTLQRMPPADVMRMRRAARRTAERYTDDAVLEAWRRELPRARERNRAALDDSRQAARSALGGTG